MVDLSSDTAASDGTDRGDLRFCLSQAITNPSSGGDTIRFASSLTGATIALSSAVTEPTGFSDPYGQTSFIIGKGENITLDGTPAPGLAINGQGATRLFAVEGGGTLNIDDLTLSGGQAFGGGGGGGFDGGGGGAGLGGAVLVDGSSFTASGCTFVNNDAAGGGGGAGQDGVGGGGGGGLAGQGGNASMSGGGAGGGLHGGLGGRQGAMGSAAHTGGGGGGGGGGKSPLAAGGAGGAGGFGGGGGGGGAGFALGGLGGFGGGGGGGGTVAPAGGFGAGHGGSGPVAGGGGGAGLGGAVFGSNGTLTLTDDTFTQDSASGGTEGTSINPGRTGEAMGGAVFARNGTLHASFDTFSSNTVTNGDNTSGSASDLYVLSDGSGNQATATVINSILGQNGTTTISDFFAGTNAGGTAPNLVGSNDNLVSLNSAASNGLTGTITGNNPEFAAAGLANNGGPTDTIALTVASNAALKDGASGTGVTLDQRGRGRAGTPDLGAYQFTTAGPRALVVNVLGDNSGSAEGTGSGNSGDLRYVLNQAIQDQAADTITFNPQVFTTAADKTITINSSLVTEPFNYVNPYGPTGFIVGAADKPPAWFAWQLRRLNQRPAPQLGQPGNRCRQQRARRAVHRPYGRSTRTPANHQRQNRHRRLREADSARHHLDRPSQHYLRYRAGSDATRCQGQRARHVSIYAGRRQDLGQRRRAHGGKQSNADRNVHAHRHNG